MNKLNKENVTGISALLVHAANIDEIYSDHEKDLIKEFIKSYLKDEDTNEILKKAEEIESNSNQLLSFTNIIKQNSIETKKNIIDTYRNLFKNIKEKITSDISELNTLNLISYDINLRDCFFELNALILILDTKFYNYYEAIEILENCTTNNKIIELTQCGSLNNDICIICQEDDQKNLVKINKCGHIFHNECLLEWLTRNNSCPICRISDD